VAATIAAAEKIIHQKLFRVIHRGRATG
jgi:hypothetical protein